MAFASSFRAPALALLAASAVLPVAFAAGEPSPIVARVGKAYEVTRATLELRLAQLPIYQRAAMGLSDPELGRKVLEEGLLYDEMLAQEAVDRGLNKEARISWQLARARANGTLVALKAQLPAVTPADVQSYYDAHKTDFDTPERLQIWRLLAPTEADANAALRSLKKDTDVETWNRLVHDKSVDQATRLRGGNLGFLLPDGHSNEAGLVADAALYKAAQGVKDGEWVAAPVKEGAHWAVVWRRGTLKAQKRTVDEARAQITTTLSREREESARKAEIARLRQAKGVEVHPDLVGLVTIMPKLP